MVLISTVTTKCCSLLLHYIIGDNNIAEAKLYNFHLHSSLFSEFSYTFVGDNGQGDPIVAGHLRKDYSNRVCYVHVYVYAACECIYVYRYIYICWIGLLRAMVSWMIVHHTISASNEETLFNLIAAATTIVYYTCTVLPLPIRRLLLLLLLLLLTTAAANNNNNN